MKINDIFSISLKNIMRGRLKSRLSILAVAVGVLSYCLTANFGSIAKMQINDTISSTGLGGIAVFPTIDGLSLITAQQLNDIGSVVSGLKGLSPFVYKSGNIAFRQTVLPAAIVGANQDIGDIFSFRLLHGRTLAASDISGGTKVVIIDNLLAQDMYSRENVVGRNIYVMLNGVSEQFEIIGVIKSQKEGMEGVLNVSLPSIVYIPYTSMNQITGDALVERLAISCMAGADEQRAAKEVTRLLQSYNNVGYEFENISKYVTSFARIMDIITIFISAVAAISLLVGGIGVMNSMLYSIDARKGEIGICLALGQSKASLLAGFLFEAVIICLSGGAIGTAVSSAVIIAVKLASGIGIRIDMPSVIIGLAMSCICGVAFGLLPAIKAAQMAPIDSISRQ